MTIKICMFTGEEGPQCIALPRASSDVETALPFSTGNSILQLQKYYCDQLGLHVKICPDQDYDQLGFEVA